MELFVFWFFCAIVVGVVASSRGRTGLGWFFIAMLISPLLGFILVMVLPKKDQLNQQRAQQKGEAGDYAKCPFCAEVIRREAIKCKHCGSNIPPRGTPKPRDSQDVQQAIAAANLHDLV